MPEFKFNDLLSQFKTGDYKPLYFFHGEESFFIDELVKEIELNALPEEQKAFNQTILYGRDVYNNVGVILDAAMRLPMMAERQVIIVKEAQHIKTWDPFLNYLDRPNPQTILVFAHMNKKIDGRSSFARALKKKAVVFHAKPLYDSAIPGWINDSVAAKGYKLHPKATEMLVEYIGNDLSRVHNELQKLYTVITEKTITPEIVEEHIGISKDYNVFELQNAFLEKEKLRVFGILNYFKQNPKGGHITFIIGTLYRMFSRLLMMAQLQSYDDRTLASGIGVNPYFIKDYKKAFRNYPQHIVTRNIGILAEYDLKSKGVGSTHVPDDELLKEMAVRLLN